MIRTSMVMVGVGSLFLHLGFGTSAIAGDYFFMLTSEAYQDALAIGEVKSRHDSHLTFRPTRVLLGQQLPKEIIVQTPLPGYTDQVRAGDAVVLSLDKHKGTYKLNSHIFKVDQSDPAQAQILSGPMAFEARFMFQRFVNSCGRDRQYFDNGTTIFLKRYDQQNNPIGENIPIGVKRGNEWIAIEENKPVCNPIKLSLWERFLKIFNNLVPGRSAYHSNFFRLLEAFERIFG